MSRNSLHKTGPISEVWSDCNWSRTYSHNHLVHKQTLNHLAKLASLAKWLSICLWTKWLWVRVQLQSIKCIISEKIGKKISQFDILSVRQTTRNNISIRFLTGSAEEQFSTFIDVSENMMEYFFKNVTYVIVF